MQTIQLDKVTIYPEQRELRQAHVAYLTDKMKRQGFNPSYPITLDPDNGLIDGGHRVAAAQAAGLIEVPYLCVNGDTRRIYHAIRCNEDGADTQKYDVFDYAELCWQLGQSGWTGEKIAGELGWGTKQQVSLYTNIKVGLHPITWTLIRYRSTKKLDLLTDGEGSLVDHRSTIVDWEESHIRALLSCLSLNSQRDNATMRAQLKTIRDTLARFNTDGKKVTAKWIGEVAEKYAWQTTLAKYMRDSLAPDAPLSERKSLLKNINRGVFGDRPSDKDFDKFTRAVSALNEQVLGVKLYHDDALQFIPTLPDKSISLVIADPPYNVTDHEWDKIGNDEEFIAWLNRWLETLRPKLTDDFHLFLFCSPDYQASIEVMLKQTGWPLKSRIVWEHRNLVSGREVSDKYICNWEMVFHCGSHALNFPPEWDDTRFQVKQYARPQSNFEDKSHHPTAKPVKLISIFIEHGSKPGDFVLDSFAGGGTTGEAAKNVGQRRCILVEQSSDYCNVIERRLGIRRVG